VTGGVREAWVGGSMPVPPQRPLMDAECGRKSFWRAAATAASAGGGCRRGPDAAGAGRCRADATGVSTGGRCGRIIAKTKLLELHATNGMERGV
jgi:hypothetical protein